MLNKPLLFGIFVLSCAYLIFKYNTKIKTINIVKDILLGLLASKSETTFTVDELATFIGKNGGPIYLSILGNVFDVTKGGKHYGKDGSYSMFAAKDASKAFVTGDFSSSGLTDDITELTVNELSDLNDWLKMYKKDYIYKGKLIGRFYKSDGKPTPFLQGIQEKLLDHNNKKKEVDNYKTRFPPCNVEWSPETGSRFWCSKQSGGISRSWVGVPRKFYEPGSSNSRCACINPDEKILEGKFLPYEDCEPNLSSCIVKTKIDGK